MIERLLLDRINVYCGRLRIAEVVKLSTDVLANETESGLILPDVAMARAKIAVQLAPWQGFPPTRLMEFRLDCRNAHPISLATILPFLCSPVNTRRTKRNAHL